jgi:hypothetical protein
LFSIYLIISECLIFFLFGLCLRHALKAGTANIFQLFTGALFGILLELTTIYQLHAYSYGKFLLMIGNVPLAVGVAWGVIIYAVRLTAAKAGLPPSVRPILEAFLALSIDLVMDAIAIRLGMWDWGYGLKYQYFGVPFNNFWAWFWVVFSYSSGIQIFTHWFTKNKKSGAAISSIPANLLISWSSLLTGLFGVLSTNAFIVYVIPAALNPMVILAMLACALGILLCHKPKLSFHSGDSIEFWIPLAFHANFLGTGIISQVIFNPPILLWIGLAMLLISFFIHKEYILRMFRWKSDHQKPADLNQ